MILYLYGFVHVHLRFFHSIEGRHHLYLAIKNTIKIVSIMMIIHGAMFGRSTYTVALVTYFWIALASENSGFPNAAFTALWNFTVHAKRFVGDDSNAGVSGIRSKFSP